MDLNWIMPCGKKKTIPKVPILYDSISITLLKFSTLLEIESRLVAAKS